jgi:haloalkane dehalogenase
MHYVDEGPREAPPVVFIHGNPSWSYIWRKMISPVVDAGFRAIAVDLVGMGRSDKPTRMEDLSVARHVEWTRSALIDALDLRDMTLVLHDWGGIVGLRVLHHHPDRVARICLTNSGMFLRDPSEPMPETIEPAGPFAAFQKMVRETPDWPHWEMVRNPLCVTDVPQEVVDAYHAPYPSPEYLCGNRQFTQMLATTPDNPQLPDNWEAWQTVRQFTQMLATTPDNPQLPDNWEAWQTVKRFDRPMLTIFSDQDIVTKGGEQRFTAEVPGCKEQPHVILEGAGHFLQEDVPDAWLEHFIPWLEATR